MNDGSDLSSDEADEMKEIESYADTNNVAQNENATKEISCQHTKTMNPKNKDNIKRSTIEGEHQNRYCEHLIIQISFMLET